MIYSILKQRSICSKNIKFSRFINNHSYNMLQKELDKKDNIIKELKKYIKELESDNNKLKTKIETNKYQKIIYLLYR